MTEKAIRDFFDVHVSEWDLASKNFKALDLIRKKPFKSGDLKGYVQFNPARAVSTLAKLDKDSISQRKCFLCECNRPSEQNGVEILPGWELLVNPYPILPYHFTIVKKDHVKQEFSPVIGKKLAGEMEGFIVFFNDAEAGASAPDHMHFQAVPMGSLPLVDLVEKYWCQGIDKLNLPFKIIMDEEEARHCGKPMNSFYWKPKGESVRFISIPRKSHRPKSYFLEPPFRRAVSPGAIDMAGVLVTPYEEDFELINDLEITTIYGETGVTNE